MKQRIRYTHSADGTALAWARAGRGRPLVKASNWLTHLEYDLESPVWSHWVNFFAENFDFVRYDERGCGLSDREVDDLAFDRWVEDLEAVIKAADLDEPLILLGVSQGASVVIAYAAKHPERVSQIILYGGYAQGWRARGDQQGAELYESVVKTLSLGWELDNPVFREIFTKRFIPAGTDEQIHWFNELCYRTISSQMASRLLDARADVDVEALLERVTAPALVLQSDQDQVTPFAQAKVLASSLPNSELVELDSRNHILLKHESAWARFRESVLEFTDSTAQAGGRHVPKLAGLSPREREILSLICAAKSNPEIAAELKLSERTVRNHATNLFRKLGVKSRAEAILYLVGQQRR